MHDTLHQWAREHRLVPAQTQQLWQLAGLHQPASDLQHHLRASLALVAALLLGAGLIFWVAANWETQSHTFKLHLLQAAVALPLVAALLMPAARHTVRTALVLLGTLALGGLLAYIGITYQTGADYWQLFAIWAALALPAALVLRSDWLWALWLLIVATAIGSWSGQSLVNQFANLLNWRHFQNLITPWLWLSVFLWPMLIGQLGAVRDGQGQRTRPVISLRLVALLALSAWATHAIVFLVSEDVYGHTAWINYGYLINTAFVVFAGWLGWRSRWRDLVVLGMALLALNILVLFLLGKWMFLHIQLKDSTGWLLFALIAAAVVAMSGRWLYQQQRQEQI
jgi:Predicted membrane protein